jgi:hypothetical protein
MSMPPEDLYRVIDKRLAAWLDQIDWLVATATAEQAQKLLAAKTQVFEMKKRLDQRALDGRWFDPREEEIVVRLFMTSGNPLQPR